MHNEFRYFRNEEEEEEEIYLGCPFDML